MSESGCLERSVRPHVRDVIGATETLTELELQWLLWALWREAQRRRSPRGCSTPKFSSSKDSERDLKLLLPSPAEFELVLLLQLREALEGT